jgi:hypothetical protein
MVVVFNLAPRATLFLEIVKEGIEIVDQSLPPLCVFPAQAYFELGERLGVRTHLLDVAGICVLWVHVLGSARMRCATRARVRRSPARAAYAPRA